MDTFVLIFVYLDFTWTKFFDINHVIKKVVCVIFNINFFCLILTHLYTNTIISIKLICMNISPNMRPGGND